MAGGGTLKGCERVNVRKCESGKNRIGRASSDDSRISGIGQKEQKGEDEIALGIGGAGYNEGYGFWKKKQNYANYPAFYENILTFGGRGLSYEWISRLRLWNKGPF